MQKNILAIDQGTTGTKVLIMDTELRALAEQSTPFEQHFPKPGWVEHDLNQIWVSVTQGIVSVTKKVNSKTIAAIGITNQRETICFWHKATLEPLAKALVWQDRRTAARCEELRGQGWLPFVQQKTGLLLDPYFSATKLEWMLAHNEDVKSALKAGVLAVGTIDTYLLARLTGGFSFATEPSNASRTLLFNLEQKKWDPDLLKLFQVPEEILPQVLPTFAHFGVTKGVRELPDGIPITGMIGDQQSALLGQACIEKGQAKCTFGTGAFLLMNTGTEIKRSQHQLLTTVAWAMSEDQSTGRNKIGAVTYALEGSAFMAGATFQWLRDGLGMIERADQLEALALQVQDSGGVFLVPAFTGLGAPYWDPHARASLSGLTRGSTRAHIARAALEGVAFQNGDILKAMESDLGQRLEFLNVDGGACKNNLLMQIQSDVLQCKLNRPRFTETTSLGAIFAAGMGANVWTSLNEIKKVWKCEREFLPQISPAVAEERDRKWQDAVRRVR